MPSGSWRPHTRGDGGVATVFACLTLCLLVLITALGLRLGGAVLARQRAETAADLGALAGAADILAGPAAACAAAAAVVQANHAQIVSCRTEVLDVLIEVSVSTSVGAATGHARAGPVTTR